MSSSTSAASPVEDENGDNTAPGGASDSDMEEIEVEVEVEEEFEVEEVENEEDSSDSECEVSDDHKDVNEDMESRGHDKHVESGHFPKEPQASLLLDSSAPDLNLSGPSDEKLKTMEPCLKFEDVKYPKTIEDIRDANGSREYVVVEKCSGGLQEKLSHEDHIEEAHLVSRYPGLATSEVGTRKISPYEEPKDMNKRQAIICDFFVKGWCIKGRSCKFLHVKDNNTSKQEWDENAVGNGKKVNEALSNAIEKPSSPAFPSSLINRGSTHIFRNTLLPEHISSSDGSVMSSSSYCNGHPSYASNQDEISCTRSNYMCIDHSSPVSSLPLISGSNTSFQTTGMSSHQMPWARSSTLSSFSWTASPLVTHKHMDGDTDRLTSRAFLLLRSSSSSAGHEPENSKLSSSGYLNKISSYNWEPSEPFCPSFIFPTTSISSPALYDPLRDSMDDSTLNMTQSLDLSNSKISSHLTKSHDTVLEKSSLTPENVLETGAEVVAATSLIDEQSNDLPKLEPAYAKDIKIPNKIGSSRDSRHRRDRSQRKKDLNVDRVSQDNNVEAEEKSDGGLHKESRAMRHFRAALVDLVKEMLKPAWRDGNLSKDAHNLIVRKAVEKVLGTLQSHQIPSSVELVSQYLSSSRPKIVKLVEGYVDKYRKS